MQYTTNYNLGKPDPQVDSIGPEPFNADMDVIDAALHGLEVGKFSIAGGTLTGPLTLADVPTEDMHAATKGYVDTRAGQIGEIKTSPSTAPGPNWLLCNGDRVMKTEYPDLYATLNRDPTGTWEYFTGSVGGSTSVEGIKEVNGYTVIYGYHKYTDDSYYPFIAYKLPSAATFTIKTFYGTIPGGHKATDIIWDGTQYVMLVPSTSLSGSYHYLYYNTTLSGTWTQFQLPMGYCTMKNLVHAVGYYAFIYSNSSDYPSVAYSNTLTGTWSTTVLNSANETTVNMRWTGSRWEIVTRTYSNDYPVLYHSPTVNTGYSRVQYSTQMSAFSFAFVDGKYFLGGHDSGRPYFRYSEDFTNWTKQYIYPSNVQAVPPSDLCYNGHYWIAWISSTIIYSDNLYSTTWTKRSVTDLCPEYLSSASNWRLAYLPAGEEIMMCNASAINCLTRYAQLPIDSVRNAYVYMRANREAT